MDSTTKEVSFLTISALHEGQRIDNFLITRFKDIPKSRLYKAIRKGEVRVNKKRVKPEYRLQIDDEIRIPPLVQAQQMAAKMIPLRLSSLFKSIILYEDDDFLVVNKPAKFAVHTGSGIDFGIIDIAREFHPLGEALQLVHRLDRDTSGCLLISKTRPALIGLQALLTEQKITKTYLALTKGRWANDATTIQVPLLKNTEEAGERMVIVDDEGKSAKTVFNVIESLAGATLVSVDLYSGRTHQIRVHAQFAGHAVAGDEKYGDDFFNKKMRGFGLNRLFLHAHSLAFISPITHQKIHITASLPDDLQLVITELEKVPAL